jgi:hypothetical protein
MDRLQFISNLNPEVDIYGLYGGDEAEFETYSEALNKYFVHNYCIRDKSTEWKWKHSDLAYAQWYRDVGHEYLFDAIVVLEWDLILFTSIEEAYARIRPDQIGLTGLVRLWRIRRKWWWTTQSENLQNWKALLKVAKRDFGYSSMPFGCLAAGASLPRTFLEKYSKLSVPELCHDELRLPLFAQILGFSLTDTRLYRRWFSKSEDVYFTCEKRSIDPELIKIELSKPNGRRVFHPYGSKLIDEFPEYFR